MSVNHDISYFNSIQSNIIINNKEKIYSCLIEKTGVSFLKLSFANIKLPQHSYVEFQYGKNTIQREFFHDADKATIIIPDERVNIRVVLTKALNLGSVFSFELSSVEYNGDSRAIISQDERRPYMCFYRSKIVEHSLASAAAKIGEWGSCSLIGNENHVLTNRHVIINDPDLTYGEIWFNWFHQSCDSASPVNEPVRLKPGGLVAMGLDCYSDEDYALFTLDTFDYVNSNVKTLFGGLALSEIPPYAGENIYVPQYGNGGLHPMYISDMKNRDYARILGIRNNEIIFNADTDAGSSGSPVISRSSNQIVGLAWGTSINSKTSNSGISVRKLNDELGSFISDSNESVIGLGQVTSYNLEITPFNISGHLIPIDLDKKGSILPFDTVIITDYDSYSLIEVEAIDLITDEVFPLTFKASLVDEGYHTNIHDNNVTGRGVLKIYDFDIDSYMLMKFWLAFKVNDPINNIGNYVIRTVLDYYDVYDIPFDIDSAEVLDLEIWKDYELRESSVSYTIEGHDDYGFVAVYNGQGPVNLVSAEWIYSEVKVLLKHSSGDEILVNLRGRRHTACAGYTMNSAASCPFFDKFSRLTLSFHPEDNENLVYDKDGIYRGIIPLQAKRWESSTDFQDILVNVSLRDLIFASEPENLNPS